MIIDTLGKKVLLLDSAMGTALISAGVLSAGMDSGNVNLSNPDVVEKIHKANILAGADIITTNTFGAHIGGIDGSNGCKNYPDPAEAEAALRTGVRIAKKAAAAAEAGREIYTALCIGPVGDIIGMTSTLTHEDARGIFARMAVAGAEEGADLILIETMSDIEEVKDAVTVGAEQTDIPVFCSMTFMDSGFTFMGVTPEDFAREARAAGAAAVGVNCTLGPEEMIPIASSLIKAAEGMPVFVQPNAGQPLMNGTEVYYDMTPEAFADGVYKMVQEGAVLAGGCCGTTPDMIAELRKVVPQ